MATPLNSILKKGAFVWNESAWDAFEALKSALPFSPVHKMPNFEDDFVVECDASRTGIVAVLMQYNHMIAYSSQSLKGRALLLSAYEKEMLAILFTVSKRRQYL